MESGQDTSHLPFRESCPKSEMDFDDLVLLNFPLYEFHCFFFSCIYVWKEKTEARETLFSVETEIGGHKSYVHNNN